ncbi:phage portal protein [Leuconostoc pseudomesenteroides]|uniref:phage portal protein n=1 Tax=Leuconostoc pseudomesenteroides TaxID=33968 RepID=UPI0021A9010D|nr:phage portal protein [Leuconostoc pseudomesenteroides]MCT4380607.1 phage portal protein [Leuconostoc pseudomesenteroides]
MGLFKKEERSSITPTQPIIFVPQNGFTLVTSGEQAVNATPALQSAVSTISNDMNAVRFTGGQSKVLNKTDFTDTYRALLIDGNAYMLIVKGANGIVTDLVPVNNSDVTINYEKGKVTYTINNVSGDEPYSSGIYDEKDVLAFVMNRGTYGIERYIGHSPIESLENTLSQSQLANKQIESVLKESISPKLHLELMADAEDDTKAKIKQAFMNANENDSVIISDSQVKVSKLFTNDSSNDNLINLSKTLSDSVNSVATAFNIPSSKVGANAQDDAQSSVSMLEQQYLDSLIHNYLSIILNELHEKISESISLDLTPLTDFDNSKLIQQTIDLVGAGILPVDEAHTILVRKGVLNE